MQGEYGFTGNSARSASVPSSACHSVIVGQRGRQETDITFQRCKSGGHECIFEESNRGKRSTRKHEALAARVHKMEAALKGIGAVGRINLSSGNCLSAASY